MAGDYADASGAGGAGGGDGDGGGGGGALSPLSIFLLVAALQLLDGFVDLLKKVSENPNPLRSIRISRNRTDASCSMQILLCFFRVISGEL